MRALRLHEQELVDQAYAKQVRQDDDKSKEGGLGGMSYVAWLEA